MDIVTFDFNPTKQKKTKYTSNNFAENLLKTCNFSVTHNVYNIHYTYTIYCYSRCLQN